MDEDLQNLAGGNDGVSIHTGFPNPALDRREQGRALALDLNQLLVRHPSGTYLFRISGHLWVDQGVYDGDIAVIDRVMTPRSSDLVLGWEGSTYYLSRYLPSHAGASWGVVTAIIHQYQL